MTEKEVGEVNMKVKIARERQARETRTHKRVSPCQKITRVPRERETRTHLKEAERGENGCFPRNRFVALNPFRMAAPVSCFRIGETCYNEKFRALVLIRIREVEVAANQGAATIRRENIAITISDLGRSASLAANPGYLSRTEKPDVNSLWIAEQTSRSSLGQKRKEKLLPSKKIRISARSIEPPSISTCFFKSYPDLTKPNLVNRVVKHGVKHHILTTGQPVYSKARQLALDKLKLAKQEFQFMPDNDIIRPSKSQWASPLHLVIKKDGTLRPCGDYRRLNAQTIPDRYPIPRIEDFNYILKDKKIFSKIDLVKAYYQIPIAKEDKKTVLYKHLQVS
ncbi:transposon Ty3-I Gag-Pol polyprotein [Trichonephila clavipes]|nr:transposon Ty3-I Gag-Pol polyprotein [Trichonephila clavipes]